MQMVGEVVRSIAVAWKSVRAYPPDHPAVTSAVAAAQRLLDGRLLGTHRLSLGAARDGLIHGADKLDFTLARELAEVLYSRDVAIVVFEEGLTAPSCRRSCACWPRTPRRAPRARSPRTWRAPG